MNFGKIIGDDSLFPLEHKMLNTVLLLGILLSAMSGILNHILNVGTFMVMADISSIIVGVILYYISAIKKQYSIAAFLAIFIMAFVLTPIMWFFKGGVLGGTALYIVVFSSIIAILFRGTKRIAVLGSLVLISLVMIIVEYKYPFLIVGYKTDAERYADMAISLISTLAFNAFLSITILNHYIKESKRARVYFAQVEKQKMEKEMARLDRLNLIGEMAAGIGHEVRNPMTTIRGFLQLFQRNGDFSNYEEQLKVMVTELDRANTIISEFLSLAKDKLINLRIDNLNRIIKKIYPLLAADALLLGKQFVIDLGDIPELLLDENEIRQCILNFVRNSYEATGDEGFVLLKTYVDGEKVVLQVEDNGTGILPEVYEKLGTPFVTSKPQGTGLGIPICYSVAEHHNAEVKVETSSAGTIFALRFNRIELK